MPSTWATRRASSTSATEQHPESEAPPQSLSVAPTTSWPTSIKSPAATEESTPPLIATRTFMRLRCRSLGRRGLCAKSKNDRGQSADQLIDILRCGFGAHGKAERAARPLRRDSHGVEHVTRRRRAAGTTSRRRGADSLLVEKKQQLVTGEALEGDVHRARHPVGVRRRDQTAREKTEGRHQLLLVVKDTFVHLDQVAVREAKGHGEADGRGHIDSS